MEDTPTGELVESLKSQLELLRGRIHELESENAKLSSQLSSCVCQKIAVSDKTCVSVRSIEEMENLKLDSKVLTNRSEKKIPVTGSNTRSMDHLPRRYMALKLMYFGQRFYGFASEAQMEPTVESEVFKALQRTRLVSGDKKKLQYSRCGRTDKGVSSVGQVISLYLRSNLKEISRSNDHPGEEFADEAFGEEIDYVNILNRALPDDIRLIGWSPAPTDFSARFSCLSREYKYFFWKDNLNIKEMEIAGKKLIGEHDFRNFCKMDAANVHNYRRHITSFEVLPYDERFEDDQLWAVKITGSAFLWHQIRCIVAVLFLIGQGLESPNMIDLLLDIEKTPKKPQYAMAPEIPLVLRSCEFEGLNFKCSSDAGRALRIHFEKECRRYKLQAAIFQEALLSSSIDFYENNQQNSRTKKKESAHIPLLSRPVEPSYEERRAKLNAGGGKK